MRKSRIKVALQKIVREKDVSIKHLLLSGLITALFRERGFQGVIVGGSAIEFYTDGTYVSGDIDICWEDRIPPARVLADVMSLVKGVGGPRSWKVAGLWVDILGTVESDAKTDFRKLATPCGEILLSQIEQLLIERILVSIYPSKNTPARRCAAMLLAVCKKDQIFEADWKEIRRLASSSAYRVSKELRKLELELKGKIPSP